MIFRSLDKKPIGFNLFIIRALVIRTALVIQTRYQICVAFLHIYYIKYCFLFVRLLITGITIYSDPSYQLPPHFLFIVSSGIQIHSIACIANQYLIRLSCQLRI